MDLSCFPSTLMTTIESANGCRARGRSDAASLRTAARSNVNVEARGNGAAEEKQL